MATFRILLPYNYSPNDQKAIRFAIDAFAGRKETTVTLFHAYTPLPTIDVTASPENLKVRSGMTYLATELKEKEEALKVVGDRLVESGFDRDAGLAVEAGVCLTIPHGTHFQFRSLGDEPLAAVGVTMPPWPGEGESYQVEGKWTPTVEAGSG